MSCKDFAKAFKACKYDGKEETPITSAIYKHILPSSKPVRSPRKKHYARLYTASDMFHYQHVDSETP